MAMFMSFASIGRLSLAKATLIGHLSPVFTAVAAVFLLSEKLTVWRSGGVALGLAGVLVLVWPELGGGQTDTQRHLGYGYGLASAVLTTFALIMVRSLNRTESPGAIAFWFVVVSMAGGLATLPWGRAMPDGQTLALLVMAGFFGGMAHIAMTMAFRYGEASRLAPFEYVAIIWPVMADGVIFQSAPTLTFLFALPLVLSGTVFAALEGRSEVAHRV